MADNIETVMIEFLACEIDDDIPGTYTASVDKRLCDMLTSPVLKPDMKKNILKNISKTATKTIDEQIESASPKTKDQQADNSSDKTPHFWSITEERALVTLRLEMESEFTKGMKCHSTLWQKIKRELNIFDENEDDELSPQPKKRKSTHCEKLKWSEDEEKEIYVLFKKYFVSKTRPKPKACQKAINLSKVNKGYIHKRSKETLKKKLFRMIDKLNRK